MQALEHRIRAPIATAIEKPPATDEPAIERTADRWASRRAVLDNYVQIVDDRDLGPTRYRPKCSARDHDAAMAWYISENRQYGAVPVSGSELVPDW